MMLMEVMIIVMVLYVVFFFMSMNWKEDGEMLSGYECGFDSVMGSRIGFSYRFFLISILFLVFDVEITLLIPLPMVSVGMVQVLGVVWFIGILLVGLLYEYYNGVLSWIEVESS